MKHFPRPLPGRLATQFVGDGVAKTNDQAPRAVSVLVDMYVQVMMMVDSDGDVGNGGWW